MKQGLFLAFLVGISLTGCDDSISATDVPSVVLNSFKSKFPNAVSVEWERLDSRYEAEFESGGTDHAAQLSADGKLLMQKKEIHASKVPATISKLLQNELNNYSADEVEQVERDSFVYFQLELERNGQPDQKLVLASDGSRNLSIPYWD